MKLFKLALICAAASIFVMACASNQTVSNNSASSDPVSSPAVANQSPAAQSAPSDEIAAARGIYKENCVGCHRENGEGGVAEFDGEKVKVPSFKSKGALAASDEKLADYIRNGEEGEMPAFKDKLKPEEISALVKLIRTDFQGK